MNGPAEDARLHQQLLANAWHDTRQHWTDGGAVIFDRRHFRPIEEKVLAHLMALRRLQELLAAAERATEY